MPSDTTGSKDAIGRDRMFLLGPDFMDGAQGPYFCPGCAQLVGLLEFYPALKGALDVRYLGFPRPRGELVELLGEENQSCPVLVLRGAPSGLGPEFPVRWAQGHFFVEGADAIALYLAHVHGSGTPH